jgi:sulfide:quinone oxidoreductase
MATRTRQRIVVLGGGSGGPVAATNLGRRLGRAHDVVLIDRRRDHVYMPSLLFLMVGQRRPGDLLRPLQRLERRGVTVRQATVEGIDVQRGEVATDQGPVPYDHLVISLGLQTVPEAIPGFVEGAHHPWELAAAIRLQAALADFQGGRVVVGLAPGPYRCPPAPYEAQWLLDSYFRERGLRERVELAYFTRDGAPHGTPQEPPVWMDARSKERGIRQHYGFVLDHIDPEGRVVHAQDGRTLAYDLLVVVPPHRPAPVLADSRLLEGPAGIKVDPATLTTRWEAVYALGDCADLPASKAGVVAHQAAEVVAHNLTTRLTGHGEATSLRLHTL